MKDNLLEEKIIHSFDDVSVEDMDELLKNINPCDFSMEDGILQKRIERKVLKDTKAGTKKHNTRYRGLIAAAVVMICTVSFFSLNVEARELLKKLFSFIPGIGVVESDTDYYVLDDMATSTDAVYYAENDKLRIEIKSASLNEDHVEINYVAELKDIDTDYIYSLMSGESSEVNTKLADYYRLSGYGDYFEITTDPEVYGQIFGSSGAVLSAGANEYSAEKSECVFGEAAGWKNLEIKDEYIIDRSSYDVSDPMKMKVGELSLDIPFMKASAYETKEDMNADHNTCTREDVTLVADSEWGEDAFYVDVYVSDFGQYSSLDSLWAGTGCVAGGEENYPYIAVDGRKVMGRVDGKRTEGYHFVFDYDEIGVSDSYELHLPVISMVKDEEITFELGEETENEPDGRYGRKVKTQTPADPVIERVRAIPRTMEEDLFGETGSYGVYEDLGFGDRVETTVRIDIRSSFDNGRVLAYYKNSSYDGTETDGMYSILGIDGDEKGDTVTDHWTIIPLGKSLDEVTTITLKNAVYDLDYDFTFNLTK